MKAGVAGLRAVYCVEATRLTEEPRLVQRPRALLRFTLWRELAASVVKSESMRRFSNSLLNALPRETVERLHLEPVVFKVGHEIEYPGKAITHLYFVEAGMASLTTTFTDGSQVEVGMFGYESVIGVSGLMGSKQSLNRVYTQIAGNGYRVKLLHALQEFRRGDFFQDLTLRYVQAQLLQTMQSAGCNAKHEVEQRLARWLLLCADRAGSDSFYLSQEFLSDMLGTTRTTVTTASGVLKSAGLIDYSRANLRVLDRKGLESVSCECYCVIKDHLDSYTAFDSNIVA